MRRSVLVSLAAVFMVFTQVAQAEIRIVTAAAVNGQIEISGNQAPPSAPISWQGVSTGLRTNPGGVFRIVTTTQPENCVGKLTIGSEERMVVIVGCLPATAGVGVPKTGQTISTSAGDDGDLQRGVVWPNPRFVINGNGTVTDKLTKLVWLKDWTCLGVVNWQNALGAAAALADGQVSCGVTDGSTAGKWRLPNRNELASLLDLGRSEPALPLGHPFTVDVNDGPRCWTSTTVAGSGTLPWVLDFTIGLFIDNTDPVIRNRCVTAVRDGS